MRKGHLPENLPRHPRKRRGLNPLTFEAPSDSVEDNRTRAQRFRAGYALHEAMATEMSRRGIRFDDIPIRSKEADAKQIEFRIRGFSPDTELAEPVEVQVTLHKGKIAKIVRFLRAAAESAGRFGRRLYIEVLASRTMEIDLIAERAVAGMITAIRRLRRTEDSNVIGVRVSVDRKRHASFEKISLFAQIPKHVRALFEEEPGAEVVASPTIDLDAVLHVESVSVVETVRTESALAAPVPSAHVSSPAHPSPALCRPVPMGYPQETRRSFAQLARDVLFPRHVAPVFRNAYSYPIRQP